MSEELKAGLAGLRKALEFASSKRIEALMLTNPAQRVLSNEFELNMATLKKSGDENGIEKLKEKFNEKFNELNDQL